MNTPTANKDDKHQTKRPNRHSVAQGGAIKSHSWVQLEYLDWGMSLWAAISLLKTTDRREDRVFPGSEAV